MTALPDQQPKNVANILLATEPLLGKKFYDILEEYDVDPQYDPIKLSFVGAAGSDKSSLLRKLCDRETFTQDPAEDSFLEVPVSELSAYQGRLTSVPGRVIIIDSEEIPLGNDYDHEAKNKEREALVEQQQQQQAKKVHFPILWSQFVYNTSDVVCYVHNGSPSSMDEYRQNILAIANVGSQVTSRYPPALMIIFNDDNTLFSTDSGVQDSLPTVPAAATIESPTSVLETTKAWWKANPGHSLEFSRLYCQVWVACTQAHDSDHLSIQEALHRIGEEVSTERRERSHDPNYRASDLFRAAAKFAEQECSRGCTARSLHIGKRTYDLDANGNEACCSYINRGPTPDPARCDLSSETHARLHRSDTAAYIEKSGYWSYHYYGENRPKCYQHFATWTDEAHLYFEIDKNLSRG